MTLDGRHVIDVQVRKLKDIVMFTLIMLVSNDIVDTIVIHTNHPEARKAPKNKYQFDV